MVNVSVISFAEKERRVCHKHLAGNEVTYIYSPRSRRKLRRQLASNRTTCAVVCGDAPEFVEEVLKKEQIPICTGERLLKIIYPRLVSRAAKMGGDDCRCTIYDDLGDQATIEIIKCASEHFRRVHLCTASPNASQMARTIMDMTGLALGFGETEGVGIVRAGRGGGQKIMIDLTTKSKALFCDKNRNIITPSLAEALAGDTIDENVLSRLDLKIHSLC